MHRYPLEQIKSTNASIHYLIDRIKKDGHVVDVLTFKKFDRLSSTTKFLKSILWIFYSPFLVIGKKYDVLFLDDSFPFYPFLVKLVSPKSKVVIRLGDLHLMYYTSGWFYNFLHFFEKMEWRSVDEILCISDAMASYVSRESQRGVYTVLDPVDVKQFKPTGPSFKNRVLFHGLLTKNKNVDVLIEAAKLMPYTQFIVLGDGPDMARLSKLSRNVNNFSMPGWVNDVPGWIDTCAVGVALRSDNRGNEFVVTSPFVQYGAMGKPCLVTRRKVFGDYKWQFTGVSELVEKLTLLLKDPWDEGQKLREHILENHDAEKIACQIMDILLA
jgi:glycosyltransferase involved in cell wall biosynthesis